ncbi:ABC transporter permease [Oscillospiraceae bacterium Marseille-Q3528]|nr:ABC transporter permease [Oscillospiraceae bacterium Marseille-Q3528]
MKKQALHKDFTMEIRRTPHRFGSIFLIVALGVAFFSGIRATEPDMRLSADAYYDHSALMDIRVLGDLGMTAGDVEAIREVEGVQSAVPEYSCDVQWKQESDVRNVRLMSLDETINRISVTEGRLPETTAECLMDQRLAQMTGTKPGDVIPLCTGDDTPLEDRIATEQVTVVGIGTTSLYLSLERGTTAIGDGALDGFLVLRPEAFTMEAYTQIAVTVEGAAAETCYTDAYDAVVDRVQERLEAIAEERCALRYAQVQTEARDKIAQGNADIAEAKAKLSDARQELTDGEEKLSDARDTLASHERDLADGRQKVNDAQTQLADGEQQLADGWEAYEDGVAQAVDGMDELKESQQQLADARTQLENGYAQIDSGLQQIQEGLAALDMQEQVLLAQELPEEQRQAALDQIAASRQALLEQQGELQQQRAQLDTQETFLAEKEAQWRQGNDEIHQALEKLRQAKATLEEKEQELADGRQKLADAGTELSDGEKKLADAKEELADAERELADGQREFAEKSQDAEKDIADGEQKLSDAQEALDDLEVPEWYVLDRNTLETYVEYGQNADRIGAIGKVFPVIFFLVAALVSLTTMTRMVEEQRTQIGTMKALGYERTDIAEKYVCYALLASVLGSMLGCVVGQKLLPAVIIQAYKIMYNNLPDVLTPMNPGYSLLASFLAVACTVLAALSACWRELRSVPAVLMRPEPPKAGKRVLLERVGWLWRRLNFSQKSTVRNLMRYKKRFFMTIFGIGGCMALLLVGFGIRDSLVCIGDVEFGQIRKYDAVLTMEKDCSRTAAEKLEEVLRQDARITGMMRAEEKAVDVSSEAAQTERSAYLIVPADRQLEDFITLRQRTDGTPLSLSEDGIVITEKLAKLLHVQVGQTIFLKEDDTSRHAVKITGITENYYMHYIYMSPELYASIYGAQPDFQEIFLDTTSSETDFEDALRTDYMEQEAVAAVSFLSGTSARVRDMLRSMDTLIYVLVISAGLLAFVVLFNLNHINITERRRELATLRVLGFYEEEVSLYVFRENVVLTVIGAGVGAGLGMVLHRFVIMTAEIDTMMFGRHIAGMSFVYSILLTFLFSGIVNVGMHVTLKKINMVESLKSVE